jgi:hypothetical protein
MKTYSLYLSTLGSNVVNKSNLANVTFNVNWDALFKKEGVANLRVAMIAGSSNSYSETDNNGSLRLTLPSNYVASSGYGVNASPITLETRHGAGTHNLYADSIFSNGVTVNIPKGNGTLTVFFINRSETLMSNIQEYQLWLYFDCHDE